MTKYIKICLVAMIGIMFSSVANAAMTNIWDGSGKDLFRSHKPSDKETYDCEKNNMFPSTRYDMNCTPQRMADNTICFKCSCDTETFPYTVNNCGGPEKKT